MPKARPASPVRINSIPKAVKAGILALSVAPVADHAGEEGAEAWVGVQGRELQRAPEVLDVALAGIDGLLDVVERVAVFAAAGLDAGERGEGGEYRASAAMARSRISSATSRSSAV